MRHATHSTQHATRNTQHTAHSTQRAARNTLAGQGLRRLGQTRPRCAGHGGHHRWAPVPARARFPCPVRDQGGLG
eukprot:12192399-Alexandrium_andersonii.AAC.1